MTSAAEKVVRPVTATRVQPKATFFRKTELGTTLSRSPFFSGGRSIQPKLEVSQPGDPQETEADQTAEHVMRMPAPVIAPAPPSPTPRQPELQRADEKEREDEQEVTPVSPMLQRAGEPPEEQEQVQPKLDHSSPTSPQPSASFNFFNSSNPLNSFTSPPTAHRRPSSIFRSDVVQRAGRGPPVATAQFENNLTQSRGGGHSLPAETRSFMESRFQHDFSGVRIHTDVRGQELSKTIHAQAFTHGGNIYFNSGKYDPDSALGRTLLAHELTHTIQQGASPSLSPTTSSSSVRTATGASVAAPRPSPSVSRSVLQRQAAVPQLAAAVAKAKAEEGKVNASKPGPDGYRTGWQRLLEYFKTSMGEDKIVSGSGAYVPGTVSEQVIKTKSEAMGQVANQPPDVQAMRDAMPSWCGIFVFWALNKGGVPMPKWQLGGPAMKREAAYPPGRSPATGDIAYRNQNSHYALVEKTEGAGAQADVVTINGNTAGEDNLGAQVQTRTHKLSNWTGFFNPLVLMEGSLRDVADPDAKPKSLRELRRELFRVNRAAETDEPLLLKSEVRSELKSEVRSPKSEVPAPNQKSAVPANVEQSAHQAGTNPVARQPEHQTEPNQREEDEEPELASRAPIQRTPSYDPSSLEAAHHSRSLAPCSTISAQHEAPHFGLQTSDFGLSPGFGLAGSPCRLVDSSSCSASARAPPVACRTSSPAIAASWLSDAWDAVSGFASEAAEWVEQGLEAAKRWLLGKVRDFVREIPGYDMLCFVLAEDPITGAAVERTGRNLLHAGLGLHPLGSMFETVLERIGAVDEVAAYLDGRISDMSALVSGVISAFSQFWDRISLDDVGDPEAVFNRVADLLRGALDALTSFITRAAVDFLEMIKRIMIRQVVDFVRGQIPRFYPLLCVVLGHDPVTNEEVARNGTNILNAVLEVSEEGQEQRRQMQETGTFQRIAGFIDRGIAVFTTAYQQIRAAITNIWDFVTIESLFSPIETFNRIYDQFAAPVRLVTDYIVDVAVEILRVIKEVLMARLSAYARTIRGYPLVTVIIGRDPFTDERVPRSMENIIRGFMSLMDGGEEQFRQLQESGAIARTTARINAAVARLNMTPAYIVELFTSLWNSFSLSDLAQPVEAFRRIMATFGEPIRRLVNFVIEIVKIVVEVILQIMNFPVDLIANIINRTLQAFELIKRDPVGFLKNLLAAIKQGFVQFFDNILRHLLNGVVGWLMGELRDAGVPALTDFSLRGVIGWVLEVLGISMEKIWEKLAAHPRIGPERVARIRGMISRLEGIWTFIKDVQERGMAAIWDKIQEQLSNLWDTVLDAVKNWIMEKIITAVVTKILSFLDPTGIMAVINSAIAIYRAIQSFIRYITQMLQVVNAFVEGVVEIAQGSIARAANALESAMDRAMPIVIGFLANQVGLGGVGRRVAEMIERVREMVDRALTWLVNKAVDTGAALLDRVVAVGRSAVAAVRSWAAGLLGIQKPFTAADNTSHRLYYAESGDNVRLMLNPSPAGEYHQAMNAIQPPPAPNDRVAVPGTISVPLKRNNAVVSTVVAQPESDGKIGMGVLKTHALTVASHIDGLIESKRRTSSDQSQQAQIEGAAAGAREQTEDFTASLDGLSRITAYLISVGPTGPLPVTPVPAYGGLASGFATRMAVTPLTSLGVPGTEVSVDSPDYSDLLLRRETPGGRSFYIAGHLLNNNVHGSGTTWQNLTPIAQRTNQEHENRVESKVKDGVLNKGMILDYTVDVSYGMPRKDNLIREIEHTPNWSANSVLSQKHRILQAEARLPNQLRCTVKQLKPDGTDLPASDPGFDPAYNISGGTGTIDNAGKVPQDSLDNYYLSSTTAVTYRDLTTLTAEATATLTSNPATPWDTFYNNPANKVSIDNLSNPDREQLRNVFRKQELITGERDRIQNLAEIQTWTAFQAGRVSYTGPLLDNAEKEDLRTRFEARIGQLRTQFLQRITTYVRNDLTDPNTRWGDFRNNMQLAANLPQSEIDDFRSTVFDPRITELQTASAANQP